MALAAVSNLVEQRTNKRGSRLRVGPAVGARPDRVSSLASQRGENLVRLRDVSVGRGLLDRQDVLETLDRALTKRVTVISAPPGSGKTSLLRVWADRAIHRRVAVVSVGRDQQDGQRFWSAVLDAIRNPVRSIDPERQPAATTALEGDLIVDEVLSELTGQVEPVVLVIDDLPGPKP